MPEPHVTIFVKAPRLGTVKTRLAQSIGDQAALDAYLEMTELVLAQLDSFQHVDLRYTPDDAIEEIKPWLREHWTATPQGEGDLGERMHRVFAEAQRPKLLIGSDCPHLNTQDLQQAGHALKSHDLTIGPASDGGYWMIGMNQPHPALFESIPWGTSEVFKTTLQRAENQKLRTSQGRLLSDIDYLEDWVKFKTSQQR